MRNKKMEAAKTAALLCAPLLVLAAVPAAQRAISNARAAKATATVAATSVAEEPGLTATQLLLKKVGGDWDAQGYDAESLLRRGADANAQDEHSEPALVKAVWAGEAEDVRTLLAHGAKAQTAPDDYGAHRTAISFVREEIRQRREHGISVGGYAAILQMLQAVRARE